MGAPLPPALKRTNASSTEPASGRSRRSGTASVPRCACNVGGEPGGSANGFQTMGAAPADAAQRIAAKSSFMKRR
jgi:hypothetical protein